VIVDDAGDNGRVSWLVVRGSWRLQGGVMKVVATITAIVAVMSVSLVAQEKKVPKDSFRVTVPGCTKGMVFTAGPRTEDQQGRLDVPEGIHLRMNGPKKLIAEIRAHEGQMIQVTGLMKKGQYGQQGFPIGGGVRVIPGTGGSVGNRPTVGTEGVNYIDVESWQPAPGSCPG
jgi:hypothetical protein